MGEVGRVQDLHCQRAGTLQAPVREGVSALTTVVFGWLPDGKVLWWKAPCLGGEVISQMTPDI